MLCVSAFGLCFERRLGELLSQLSQLLLRHLGRLLPGFIVWDLALRVSWQGLWFGIWRLGFEVRGLEFRVWGFEFGVWGLGFGV